MIFSNVLSSRYQNIVTLTAMSNLSTIPDSLTNTFRIRISKLFTSRTRQRTTMMSNRMKRWQSRNKPRGTTSSTSSWLPRAKTVIFAHLQPI